MSSIKKGLKAFVRYDANKQIVPGSTIFRKNKPTGNFIETNADLCCPTVSCLQLPEVTLTVSEVTGCPDRTQIFTISNLPAYDSITWFYTETNGSVVINSGQGTESIEVSYGNDAYDIEFFVALFRTGSPAPIAYQTFYASGLSCTPIP